MTERLNNDQISQLIIDTNSDLKLYLNLAPGLKITPPKPKTLAVLKRKFPRPHFHSLL